MQYNDGIEDSRRYLRLTLELIGKHGLPTDPLNYCIWYEYVSGHNEELKAAIDNHLEKGETFSTEINQQFFSQYIATDQERLTTLVRKELNKVFAEIIGTMNTADQFYSQSANNMQAINEAIVPNLPQDQLKTIVKQIKNEITSLEGSSSSFREQLQQANSEIEQLKNKMALYRTESLKDPLTQIGNRRGFDKALSENIAHAQADGTSLCLIIADIDFFKKVNDTYGHLVGDNVIRMVAATLKDSIKGKDLAARIGGEEFAILLPDTPVDGAMKLANDIRLAFERLDLKKKSTGESLGKITLS
uniref:diguanylate cyclase n=1 Tax=Desulfosarcina sp. TaxID=2027861 RepID=UPI003561BB9B